MALLQKLPPLFGKLPTLLAPAFENRDRFADRTKPWRKWYDLKRWKDLRWQVLLRDHFTCQLCGHLEGDTSQLVCDHVEPHRGDPIKFWDGALQTLCAFCHRVHKQSQEAGSEAATHPAWLKPSVIPMVLVCGPPASGKSEYVKARAGPFHLVIDLDDLAGGLFGVVGHEWNRERWLGLALRKRNAMLGYLSRSPRWSKCWFIVGEPRADLRQWWCDKLDAVDVVVMAVPEAVCVARAARDADRDQSRCLSSIQSWWREYTPRNGDVVLTE